MLSSHSGVLTKTISISFTFLQQVQSISIASFLQCPHFHQPRFPILICNQQAAEARICLVFFLMALIPIQIYYSNMNKTAVEAYVQFQKQPPAVFCKKSCSLKFRKFHRKTPVLESLFNKVAGLQACKFIKKRLQYRCFREYRGSFIQYVRNIFHNTFQYIYYIIIHFLPPEMIILVFREIICRY